MKGNNVPFAENIILSEKEYVLLNDFLSTRSYFCDFFPTEIDRVFYKAIVKEKNLFKKLPHLNRWYNHIGSFGQKEQGLFPVALNEQTTELILILTKAYTERKVKCR